MSQNFSPWLEIWIRPRATIRRIVNEKPNRSIWVLATIYGFGSLMKNVQSLALGQSLTLFAIFLIVLLLASVWGYVFFSAWSGVVYWVGKLFKGKGTFQSVRAAYAWSCVPLVINIPMWILLTGFIGKSLFEASFGSNDVSGLWFFLLFSALIIRLVMAVWSLVIYFNALAEVQNYSVLKSILNVVASGAALFAVAWLLWAIGSYFIHPAAHMLNIGSMLLPLQNWAVDCYKL